MSSVKSNVAQSILAGASTVKQTAGSARLQAFMDNMPERVAVDNMAEFRKQQELEKEKQADFVSGAIGAQKPPSNHKMYGQHHSIAKAKFDALYSEATLKAASQNANSMARWSAAVNALATEVGEYEAFYQTTFGDPQRADGSGNTYSDYIALTQNGTVPLNNALKEKGLRTNVDENTFKSILPGLDSPANVANLNYDPATGGWNGLPTVADHSVDAAAKLFFIPKHQAEFSTPSDFALDSVLRKTYNEYGVDELITKLQSQRERHHREALAHYQREEETDEKLKLMPIEDYAKKREGDMDTVYEAFEEEVVRLMRENKTREDREREEAEARKKAGQQARKDSKAPAQTWELASDNQGIQLTGTKLKERVVRNGEDWLPYIVYKKGGDLIVKVRKKHNVEGWQHEELNKEDSKNLIDSRAPGEHDKMMEALSGDAKTTSTSTRVTVGDSRANQ